MDQKLLEEIKSKPDDELIRNSHLGGTAQEQVSSLEMTRRLKDTFGVLNESIINLDKSTSKYSRILIWLTFLIIILAAGTLYFAYLTISLK